MEIKKEMKPTKNLLRKQKETFSKRWGGKSLSEGNDAPHRAYQAEHPKKLDQKILELFDELEIQFDGSKRHYAFSGSHEKPPIREIRTAARAFQFKYGANVDGKDTFDQRDESAIARGETWRSVWNITKEEKKAFALTWDSKEKKARLTIMDYSDRF